jgi:enoyl-CoA hydratase
MSEETLCIAIRTSTEGVATIELNRPEKRNAINAQMSRELVAALDRLETDNSVRVLVIGARGKAFCAGHDLSSEHPLDLELRERGSTSEGKFVVEQEMVNGLLLKTRNFTKPTIARVQGPAIAAGWALASMCDLVLASTEAAFQNPMCRMATAGPAIFVEPWDLGVRKAKELLFTGESLAAKDAMALGFVNHVHELAELDERTEQMAKRIASAPPWPLRLVKHSFNKTLDFMGQRDSWDYQFALRHVGHASTERREFLKTMRESKSTREFIAARDKSFK